MSEAATLARPRGVAPRPVYCVIADAHRDRAVAEAAAAGRFGYFGTTLELGVEPDWLGASLPPDEEWRIAWSKFHFGLDLAHAYADGGDERFLEAWERLVGSWIAQVPTGLDTTDVTARRIASWVYAWSAFAAAPGFRGLADGLEQRLLASLAEQTAYVREQLTPGERNHRTLELYALLVMALALPGLDPDGELCACATAGLEHNLLAGTHPDGVQREASSHYHCIVLQSFLGARENARRFGLRFGAAFDERLHRACDVALHLHRPDGAIPALSDADAGSYRDLLALGADLLDRDDLRYAASAGAYGRPPRQRYVSFPAGGYHVQRSGWGDGARAFADERFLVLDCGPLGDGGHGHYDLLAIELAGGGGPLVVDPGRFTYAEDEPNLRRWFKSTAAHSTVCVDGLDQTPYRRGKPRGAVAEGRLLERLGTPGLDVLHAEAVSPCYEAVHRRRVTFVADEYWVIEDRLEGDRPHRYDLRFQLAPALHGVTSLLHGDGWVAARAPGFALIFVPPHEPYLAEGWYAPEYGRRLPAPAVGTVAAGRASATFLTVAVPLDAGRELPAVRLLRDAAPTVVEVDGPVGRDLLQWEPGEAAWVRHAVDGSVVASRVARRTQAVEP